MLRRLIDFFTNMDARAWRTVAVSFVLFGGVGWSSCSGPSCWA
jgi:hypothetical protein